MNSAKKREIEAKLQKMLKAMGPSDTPDTPSSYVKQAAPCNIIRRRKGEADKRIYVS